MYSALTPGIFAVSGIKAVLEDYEWVFPTQHQAQIDAFWQRETSRNDQLFNGEVLLQHDGHIIDGVFHARYFPTRYKPFLAWMRMGCPPPLVRNGFAMAGLRSADGAFLLGKMAEHTANAGKIYFAAGTPDLADVIDGHVDLYGSACRELYEETGLHPQEVRVDATPLVVVEQNRVAIIFPAQLLHLNALEAREIILERISKQSEPELSDIIIVRAECDIDSKAMPSFQINYLLHIFTAEHPSKNQG